MNNCSTDKQHNNKPAKNWSIEVQVNNNEILRITENLVGGVNNIRDYTDTIRHAAKNLLGFIGE